MSIIRAQFQEAQAVLEAFLKDESNIKSIELAGEIMLEAFRSQNKLISCGNGGSMCDAMHLAEELSGRFRGDRAPLAAMAISDPSYLTCTINDYGADKVFSRFVEGMGFEGDVLVAISTSGNSANVINATKVAKSKGMKVIAITGKTGGELATLADVEIRAPHSDFADRAQEIHIKVIHSLIHYVETSMF